MTQAGDLQPRRGLGQCFMTLGTFQEVCKLVRNCKKRLQSFQKVCKMRVLIQRVQIVYRVCTQ